jgi:homoserine dehydrogenase
MRLSVRDRPGVLARVASALADGELSIETVLQQGQDDAARLVMILHQGREDRMMAAIEQIAGLADVREPPVVLHVLANGGGH